jgi:hypothetical protein
MRRNVQEATIMDIKLTILFLFISAMITFSYLSDENIERLKQQMLRLQWRAFKLRRNKI